MLRRKLLKRNQNLAKEFASNLMKLVISDEEKLDSWEALINTVDKTDIPIRFVRNINIVYHSAVDNVDEQDINVQQLRGNGWNDPELEEIVEQVFKEQHNNIKTVHFYLDVQHVAEVVQQQTNTLLEGTK